jgi:cobalt/nickel transport system permease protein
LQEPYAHGHSVIHPFDARVKVIFTLSFVLFLSLTPYRAWPATTLFLTAVLSAALLSGLGVGVVLKRALVALPFALAAVPLIFTGPEPLAAVTILNGPQIVYSPAGFERFLSVVIRSWISVQAAVLLAATTRFPDLLAAFRQLKAPRLLVATVGLAWRYLFVISDEATRMLRARASRSAAAPGVRHAGGSVMWRARVTGGMAGSLLLRSIERSDRVYAAMLSRGYSGDLPASDTAALAGRDRFALILGVSLLALLWVLGLLTGG